MPNEDALCIVDHGDWVVMAVADAHFGHEASHALIEWLHGWLIRELPTTGLALAAGLEELGREPDPATGSESTFLVALFDRQTATGSVVNFGDSTLAVVTAAGEYRQLNVKDDRYVACGGAWPVDSASIVDFTAASGDTLLMFTDGVDECHYRRPATSVRPHHIVEAVRQAGADPIAVSDEIVRLALTGVGGHPGGQDNCAVIVALV